jgi:hypothetical protein
MKRAMLNSVALFVAVMCDGRNRGCNEILIVKEARNIDASIT